MIVMRLLVNITFPMFIILVLLCPFISVYIHGMNTENLIAIIIITLISSCLLFKSNREKIGVFICRG
ncbi:hypothetical protein AWU65_03950 [Paenibacillus glucanolyticus]|uniref:Uncharacterized protein n=1 Tax=Paenibacillus glucanolyticus TaxID=59843 RepID=A0A163GTR8_9BACL|nr:hypothetical protein AWU65_03950 [Paenibacillus glucanolyticus]OMF64422.1 hypothetical protein BK142_31895 [Paenibacillus glucanolyticus]